ncbi:MAG: hypothetical protein PUD59_01770 [bacterium]|nr:hypothetical protein [bacterium]
MKVLNPNEIIRKNLIKKYGKLTKENALVFIEDFQYIKYNNNKEYLQILASLYPFFYLDIINISNVIGNYNKKLNNYDSIIQELNELKDVTDLEEIVSEEPNLLFKMYNSALTFEKASEIQKIKYICSSKEFDFHLFKINKNWLFDKIQYSSKYTKENLFDMITKSKDEINETFGNKISYEERNDLLFYQISNYLNELKLIDLDNYENLFLQILQDSYYYYKYNFCKKNMPSFFEEIIINKLEKSFEELLKESESDLRLMFLILEGFYKFNIKSEIEKHDISNFLKKFNYENKIKIINKNRQNQK